MALIKGMTVHMSPGTGAILVYCGRRQRKHPIAASNHSQHYFKQTKAVKRDWDGREMHIALFEHVPPGEAHLTAGEFAQKENMYVTVYEGEVTEVDWT